MSLEAFSIIDSNITRGRAVRQRLFYHRTKDPVGNIAGRVWGRIYRIDHASGFISERARLSGDCRIGLACQDPDTHTLLAG